MADAAEKKVTEKEVAEAKECCPKEYKAKQTLTKYIYGSMATGLVPIPLADMAIMAGVQLKMIHALSKIYGIEFKKDACKASIAALIGGLSSPALGSGLLGSLLKAIPGVGTIAGVVSVPIMNGAISYALGKVFIQHFEAGGNLLNFKPEKLKLYFAEQFEEGKLVAKDLREKAEVEDTCCK